MRSIITTARYTEHLEAHSFAIFEADKRVDDTWEAMCEPVCECCGEEIEGRVFYREIHLDEFCYGEEVEVCVDCKGATEEKIVEASHKRALAAQWQDYQRQQAVYDRLHKLRMEQPNVNWAHIHSVLRQRGYHVQEQWG